MSNMSYCRFENTAKDLQDCWYAWTDVPDDELSEYELAGKRRIIKIAKEIADVENED